jgi:hypothetical protein
LQASSATIESKKCDIGDAAAVKKVLKGVPVKGAFHLAAVLDDAMLGQLTEAHFKRAFEAKVEGAKNLRAALPASADFLILYSSTAAVFGAAGQGNYAAANACLDSLAQSWRANGFKGARSVNWGPWKEVGMAAQNQSFDRLRLGALRTDVGLSVLFAAPSAAKTSLCCTPVEFGPYFKQFPQHKSWAFLADFATGARGAARGAAEAVELSPELVRAQVLRTAIEVTGNKALAETAPLMKLAWTRSQRWSSVIAFPPSSGSSCRTRSFSITRQFLPLSNWSRRRSSRQHHRLPWPPAPLQTKRLQSLGKRAGCRLGTA